ncbi:DUF2157 domain-containing protein [Flavobacterium sp.]|uniref:DUF2157 domain-containing protein n=1 Tax=Flavobacterium sp. TaxID=239 RepID=UPI0025BB4CDE|nr:DUF2157 domain-containing protein [Flavobacterium sp.]
MDIQNEKAAEILYQKGILNQDELVSIKAYKSLGIFSVHHELLLFLYIAVLLVVSALGILVYENIDTVGHTILIGLTLISAAACFYFSFKKAPAFSTEETFFENPVFDYVVLLGTMLTGVFFGYLQFQYNPLGNTFALASALTSLVGFFAAYRFDNRSSLSIAITTLSATIGIAITPRAVMELDIFENLPMFVSGIALGMLLVVWGEISQRKNIKRHFAPFFFGFGQHLIGICCIVGLIQDYWPIFLIVMALAMVYFFRKSHQQESTALFVFTILYSFFGANIALIRLIILTESDELAIMSAYFAPFFYIGSIALFIKSIRKFNQEH